MIAVRSVKFRLTLWYAFILTTILSVFSLFMYTEFSHALYRDTDRNLFMETLSIEKSMQNSLDNAVRFLKSEKETGAGFLSPLPAKIRLRLLKSLENWERGNHRLIRTTQLMRFQGLDKEIIMTNLRGWEREILFPDFERDSIFMETGDSFQTIHFQKKPIRLYYHLVRYQGRPLFVIQSGISIYDLRSNLDRLAFVIWISIPGAVFAACISGWFLAKRSFRPVDHMIREAKQITAAYLKGRLPRTHTGDELDRLAETLNEMMDRIELSTRTIQEFSTNISHELKTPLAIIRGEIDLALRRSRSPEALIETLKVIEGEVNELIRLVDDLLMLVRSDAKQLRFEKKPVFLRQLLEQVVSLFQERAQSKKINLSLASSRDLYVEGDPVYLKRLFSNLLDNAIKFTQDGGHVAVNLISKSNKILIEVADDGIGIENELQGKVFARFYRTDQARSQEGSGLGLSIAKAICEAHGGNLSLHSQVSRGTIVTVEFPGA